MIYAIRVANTDYVKFGHTAEMNIQRRLKMLQTGCPLELRLVAVGIGGCKEEQEIHAFLKASGKHHTGEWFIMGADASAVIEWIKDRKKNKPSLPALRTEKRGRLTRVLEYAANIDIEKVECKKKKRFRLLDLPNSRQLSSQPFLTKSLPSTEQAYQFMQSLIAWESNTPRFIVNSSSTENQIGEMQKLDEVLLN